jgi:hypothetical protein
MPPATPRLRKNRVVSLLSYPVSPNGDADVQTAGCG